MTKRRRSPIRGLTTIGNYWQRFVRTIILLPFVLVAIAGCSTGREVEEREAYWKAEAEQFFQSPRDMAELHSWLRDKQVFYTYGDNGIVDRKWVKGVEKIYVDTFACESWTILLSVTVSDEGEIIAHSIDKSGTCL